MAALGTIKREIEIHCVTRWSKFGTAFTGTPLPLILAHAVPTEEARFVWMQARSERSHGSSLPLTDVIDLCPLLATHVDLWRAAHHRTWRPPKSSLPRQILL
ncbi:MAG: hypothetical protein QM758_23180 [Armatimonas sp.]